MRRNTLIMLLAFTGAALVIGILIGRLTKKPVPGEMDEHTHEETAPEVWTCSMHPQIQTPEQGDCPICGMDLIPLESGSPDTGPRTLVMSEAAIALAEIATSSVKREFPTAEVRLVGRLEFDETRIKSLTARFPARIDQLFVNYKGAPVKTGEHLAMIYSPELSTAQHELLMGYKADPTGPLTIAAREKLRLWDLLPEQIDEIIAIGKPSDQFELRAPVGGIVIEKHVHEGDYVQTGQPLFKIADLNRLWLFLDAYESDLPWLRYGQIVEFTVEAFPGETFSGRIAFIEPEMNRKTRTAAIRVDVPNPDGRLKAGMFARGTVRAQVATGGEVFAPDVAGKWISPMHPEIIKDGPGSCDVCGMDLVPAESLGYKDIPEGDAPLVVPASAVLRTGKRAVVYVRESGTEPAFSGREIVLGPRTGDLFIVKGGLSEGERVVTNGAFKIDSALQIQAKPSMMSMPDDVSIEELQSYGEVTAEILPGYFSLQDAMAKDDFHASKSAIDDLMTKAGHDSTISGILHKMGEADDMDTLRRPLFEDLSNRVIELVRANVDSLSGDVYLMSCPMVYDDRDDNSADWLQNHGELLNPYWGDVMLHCGLTKEKIR
jgi:Cu(I)/Ag(I) efflux system membrane fusion protein